VDQQDWLTARVEIGQPDGLAAVDGAVFVKTDTGEVVRVDPVHAQVAGRAEIDTYNDAGHYCTGLAADATSLWTCSAGRDSTDLVRLDPATLAVTARFAVDKLFDQLTLPVVGGRVWVLTGTGDRVTEVRASTGATHTYPLGRRCFQLAATTDRVYATCMLTDEVVELDATSGKVVHRVHIPHPVNISAVGDDVWVSGARGLVRLSGDLVPQAAYPALSAGPEGDLVATPDAVWVRQAAGFLFRLDTASGTVIRFAIDPVPSGGSVLPTGDAVWVSAYNDDLVYRLDPGP
jgi:streptogramin lyase